MAYLLARKEEAAMIDPETAEVIFQYGSILDPYGVRGPLEEDNTGRNYFVRRPGSDIWIWDGDLPKDVLTRIHQRLKDGSCSAENGGGDPKGALAELALAEFLKGGGTTNDDGTVTITLSDDQMAKLRANEVSIEEQ